ncbi:MAG: hypothetical protein HYZ09_00925 [Candidatus Kerfeldbacteria bacterium]|nr:hypothetical protein [Candidatus Kerfeldbacteria bacterium]
MTHVPGFLVDEGERVYFGVVTTRRDDGSWNWDNCTVLPEFGRVDFPPRVGSRYLVLVLKPNFHYQVEHALVIGQQIDDEKTINLLRLQTTIEPLPLRPEAIPA